MKPAGIFGLLAVVAITAYFGEREGAFESTVGIPSFAGALPGPRDPDEEILTPITTTATTKRSAEGGLKNYASASSAFLEAKRCHEAVTRAQNWQGQLNMCRINASRGFEPSIPCKNNGEELSSRLKDAVQALATCSPVPAEIRENYYRATSLAASEGNTDAQLCYLYSNFDLHRRFSPSEVEDYKVAAEIYSDEAFTRGDWRIVQLLSRPSRAFPRHYSLRALLSDGEPLTVYKMNRLLRLGADDAYANDLDLRANSARDQLSEQEITDADTWAADTYSKYFSDSPRLTEAPTFCESR